MATATSTTSHLKSIRETFDDEGYVIIPNVLDRHLVSEVGRHVEWIAANHPDVPEIFGHTLIAGDPFWCRLVSDPRLLDIAEQFIGPDIALFASSYFSKQPFDGMPVMWHQDGNYWPLDPKDAVVSLWLAVDDSTPENGCMRVIPGTQNMEFQEHVAAAGRNVLGSTLPAEFVDESKAVDVILKAGDVSIHGPQIAHGSNANTSPKRRCGLTIRYIPTSTRITQPWPCRLLLRGEAVPGIDDYAQMPRYIAGKHMPFQGCEKWKDQTV